MEMREANASFIGGTGNKVCGEAYGGREVGFKDLKMAENATYQIKRLASHTSIESVALEHLAVTYLTHPLFLSLFLSPLPPLRSLFLSTPTLSSRAGGNSWCAHKVYSAGWPENLAVDGAT